MQELKHLKRLSATKSMKAINQLSSAAYPGNHCPMHTSLAIASKIEGVSTLVIGASECGYYSRNMVDTSEYKNSALHWTYIVDENEVIFGCRKGVVSAIKEMDKEGAKVILLIYTCVPEVIGEDVDGVIFEVQEQVNAKVIGVDLGNFKCGSQQPGFWKTLLSLGAISSNVVEKKQVINVLGRSKKDDHTKKPKIIEVLEEKFEIRYLAPDSSISDFEIATDGKINIVLSPYLNPLAEFFEKEHKIPYFAFHSTYEVDEIKKTYENLFDELGLDIDDRLFENFEKAKQLEDEIKSSVCNINYVGAKIGAIQPLPLHTYLSKLGMTPLMIHVEDFYPSDTLWREKLLNENKDPILCMMVNDMYDKECILGLKPHIVIGDWAGRVDFSEKTIQVMDIYGRSGFELTIQLLQKFKNLNERIK